MHGRIRLNISQLKKNSEEAKRISLILNSLKGIQSVETNELTGNVLIHFDDGFLTINQILDHLHHNKVFETIGNNLPKQNNAVQSGSAYSSNEFLKTLAFKALEIAAERAILALL